jgi:hypothetical protein
VENFLNIHNILQVMNCSPPRSPDFNVIEHVEEILLEEWAEMTPQIIPNLIESVLRASSLCGSFAG